MIDADCGHVIIVIDDRCRSWQCRDKCQSSSSPSTIGGNVVIVIDADREDVVIVIDANRGSVVLVIDADRGNVHVVIVIDADRGSAVIVIDD